VLRVLLGVILSSDAVLPDGDVLTAHAAQEACFYSACSQHGRPRRVHALVPLPADVAQITSALPTWAPRRSLRTDPASPASTPRAPPESPEGRVLSQ
jgi:hypothetical protein